MPQKLHLREISEKERGEIARLVQSRTAPVRLVQWARVIQAMLEDVSLSATKAGRLAGYKSDLSGQLWVNGSTRGV